MGFAEILLLVIAQASPATTPADSQNLANALEAINSIDKIDCTDPEANCPSSKQNSYRLPLPGERDVRTASDALDNDGSACAVIGQTICETKPVPILRSNQTPEETLNSSTDPG